MLFNKKRNDMVDIRELQKRGVVKIPKKKINVPTNQEGFVELSDTKPKPQKTGNRTPDTGNQTNADFFGFANTVAPKEPTTDYPLPTTNSPDGYNKREVDTKITNLDNKIYKLEQRLELLEKKLDVNQPSNPALGPMGW